MTGNEGNHGEDVKEYYFYLDSTPTHSYMKYLYKYPQAEFPYSRLVDENRCRGKNQPEFELLDTEVFDENRYFDVFVEYDRNGRFSLLNVSGIRLIVMDELHREVDITTRNSLHPRLKEKILADAIRVL